MICTIVWCHCLSSGSAKNNKIISMLVLSSRLFALLTSFVFFRKLGDQPDTKAFKQHACGQF